MSTNSSDSSNSSTSSSSAPEPCKAWAGLNGCRRGAECKFDHTYAEGKLFVEKSDADKAKEACRAWTSEDGCSRGSGCPFSHSDENGQVGEKKERTSRSVRRRRAAAARRKNDDDDDEIDSVSSSSSSSAPQERRSKLTAEEKAEQSCRKFQSVTGCYRGTTAKGCPFQHEGLKCGNPNPEKPASRRRRLRAETKQNKDKKDDVSTAPAAAAAASSAAPATQVSQKQQNKSAAPLPADNGGSDNAVIMRAVGMLLQDLEPSWELAAAVAGQDLRRQSAEQVRATWDKNARSQRVTVALDLIRSHVACKN